ncbi:hypothetical protein ACFLQL_04350 [Verrucomicrobiota bacterium]
MNTGRILCNAFSSTCLTAAIFSASMVVMRADIIFGYRKERSGKVDTALKFYRQGRFFASTDYADTGRDWGTLTRARTITRPGEQFSGPLTVSYTNERWNIAIVHVAPVIQSAR